MGKSLNNCGGGQFMDMILMTCGLDVDNMLIFGPYFAHIFSVNLKVRSTHYCLLRDSLRLNDTKSLPPVPIIRLLWPAVQS